MIRIFFLLKLFYQAFVTGLFYKWDIMISPMMSSIAMSVSSLTVVLMSNMMNCINYDPSSSGKPNI